MKRTILNIDRAGFIGSHVVRLFVTKHSGYRIVNPDALTYAGNLENLKDIADLPNYIFVKGDITDEKLIPELINQYKFDRIIHLAAESHVDRSITDPLAINNIKNKKPIPVYGKGKNIRDWLWVNDRARVIYTIFHNGKTGQTCNIGGNNEWNNINLNYKLCEIMNKKLGRTQKESAQLITLERDRTGHDLRNAIDSSKLQSELGWKPSLQFEEGLEKTVDWYLNNQEWSDNVTSGQYQKNYEVQYTERKSKRIYKLFLFALMLLASVSAWGKRTSFSIHNEFLTRIIDIKAGHIHTSKISNHLNRQNIYPENSDEFRLRLSKGTGTENSDVVLSSKDFIFKKVLSNSPEKLAFLVYNKDYQLNVTLVYELKKENRFLNKYLIVKSKKAVTLERIDLELITANDIYQPYQIKQITAWGPSQWRPGLGQPLYTSVSGTFWGTEFPASYNYVENKTGYCGYLWGRQIQAEESYTTYKSVVGVGDDARFIQDSFFDYIDQIRIRPLRLQVQYNSWFDFANGVTQEKFSGSVSKIHHELNEKRGVPPLKAYVIDDGWEDVKLDWSDKVWKVNTDRFDADFKSSFNTVNNAHSHLGLWLSPGCNFFARPAVPLMREKGLEALDEYMSLAGPKYMKLLEDRMLELTEQGVGFFKLDGLFGHLNRREFELNGEAYGVPSMPQLNTNGFKPADERLNDAKYDELKTYYLVAGTERLMKIFTKLHSVNPNMYIVISNGAYLSPWWLQYIDAVWMINAGDAAAGSSRSQELVYRDGVYYDTWVKEQTQFPINSVFNHEPKKTETGESAEQFSAYLWMNLSRGTGFVELYLKTGALSDSDWDVLASGLKWAHSVFPYFKHSKLHGGNPKEGQVYGYTGWNEKGGYISFHNPSAYVQSYSFTLNRELGATRCRGKMVISSPLKNETDLIKKTAKSGDQLQIKLLPGEVKVLEFTNKEVW